MPESLLRGEMVAGASIQSEDIATVARLRRESSETQADPQAAETLVADSGALLLRVEQGLGL